MNDNRFVLATTNRGKAEEIKTLLLDIPFYLLTLTEFPDVGKPTEDGATFQDNALKKGFYYVEKLGLPCIAEDSGLEVSALNGAPGVYSSRFAGEPTSDAQNNIKLLKELHNVPFEKRTARFVCCAAVVFPSGKYHTEFGTVEGHIATECRGENGFGYDPLFIPFGFDKTFGEMPHSIKQQISHRAVAFRKLKEYLVSIL